VGSELRYLLIEDPSPRALSSFNAMIYTSSSKSQAGGNFYFLVANSTMTTLLFSDLFNRCS